MAKLTDTQKQEACVMFHERGMTVGQIAEHFGVSLYALTPWIWTSKAEEPDAEATYSDGFGLPVAS